MSKEELDHLSSMVETLKLSGKTRARAVKILEAARSKKRVSVKRLLAGTPLGRVAGAIYIAGILEDEKRTQNQIAAATNISPITIRNRYKAFLLHLKEELQLCQP